MVSPIWRFVRPSVMSEIENPALLRRQARQSAVFVGALPESLEDSLDQRRIEQGLPRTGAANRIHQVRAADSLQKVACCPSHDGSE
jgi:hypothetical protein